MIFLIGSGLTLISLLITTIFFKDIDIEEEMAAAEEKETPGKRKADYEVVKQAGFC